MQMTPRALIVPFVAAAIVLVANSVASAMLTYTVPYSHGAGPTLTNNNVSTFVAKYRAADFGGAPLEEIILTLHIDAVASYQITDNPNQGVGATGFDFQYSNPYSNTLSLGSTGTGTTLVTSSLVLADQPRHLDPNASYATAGYPSVLQSGLIATKEVTVMFSGASLTQELKDAFTSDPANLLDAHIDLNLYAAELASFNVSNNEQYAVDAFAGVRHETTVVYGFTAVPEPATLGLVGLAGVILGMRRRD
jgi:hypothetical protein